MDTSRIVYVLVALLLLNNRAAIAQENDKGEISGRRDQESDALADKRSNLDTEVGLCFVSSPGAAGCQLRAGSRSRVRVGRRGGSRAHPGHARALCAGP